jgi:hypothetical protein
MKWRLLARSYYNSFNWIEIVREFTYFYVALLQVKAYIFKKRHTKAFKYKQI